MSHRRDRQRQRGGLPHSLFVAMLGAALACGPSSARNLVLVTVDTLRADHLPFYGYEKNSAPFLQGLAAGSVVF